MMTANSHFLKSVAVMAALVLFGSPALAVGSEDTAPPKPTETTQKCEDGHVWDDDTKECVAPRDTRLDDDDRYEAVREFAYAGNYDAALKVISSAGDPSSSRFLTYRGFIHRKQGNMDMAFAYYKKAIAVDPGNILARSYYGMGLVTEGRMSDARAQLTQIRARGGMGTWAEMALRRAITTRQSSDY